MRARGLKLTGHVGIGLTVLVAPHAGAWIETKEIKKMYNYKEVAPHAGAWIETVYGPLIAQAPLVAPHAGAWIETVLCVSGKTF